MGLSRQEINLRRLLAKCELLCKSKKKDDERFPKYINSLDEMLLDVKKLIEPSNDIINVYQKRINAIKTEVGMISYNEEDDLQLMRENLLGLKQRHVNKGENNDLDHIINYHEDMQQKITGDMLLLTKNLREQSELANRIIKKDTDVVFKSAQLSEQNHAKLAVESSRLEEHSKKAWKCWMWIMLLVVLVVFVNMVLFMKVMKKKF